MTNTRHSDVALWFDPVCPWAWLTSRWLLEVQQVRDIAISWRVMSLQVLNEPKVDELPEGYQSLVKSGAWWRPVRIVAAAQARHGSEVVGPLYTALGTRIHRQGRQAESDVFAEALADVGLPSELVDVAETEDYDADVRASHAEGIELVGQEVGTPVIAAPGPDGRQTAFFGPVVTPAPKGEAAGRLWDGVLLVAGTPGFYELKRTRTQAPMFD